MHKPLLNGYFTEKLFHRLHSDGDVTGFAASTHRKRANATFSCGQHWRFPEIVPMH